MEFRLLRYFLAVAEELHFGKAAEKLHISQPPLSQQIKKFEEELGVQLFVRHKRKVYLTEAGKELQSESKKILAWINEVKFRVKNVAEGKRGRLDLGYVPLAMEGPLPYIIREFKATFSGVRLTIHEMTTAEQILAVRNGELHIGVVRIFKEDLPDCNIRPVQEEKYVLALPAGHRLTLKPAIYVSDLAEEPMIFLPRHEKPRLYDAWLEIFAREGLTPNIVQETYSKQTAIALVAAGMGLAFIPESNAKFQPKGVVFRKFEGKMPPLTIGMVYLKSTENPALENFLAIQKSMEKQGL